MFSRLFGKPHRYPNAGEAEPSVEPNTVPVTLLTGFLGSGKTTLLNAILRDPSMSRAAVIVNEFGGVAIDHALVRTGSERYFQTTTGCICCTATSDVRVSLYELHDAIAKAEVPAVDRVIIETTGLADPAPIINSLIPGGAPAAGLRDHIVARHYHLSRVITAFDVLSGRAMLNSVMEGWKQIAFADHVVLTKTDLTADEHDWPDELGMLNPAARFHDRHGSGFRLTDLLEAGSFSAAGRSEDVRGWLAMEALAKHNHRHDVNRHGDEIEAVAFTHDIPLDPQALLTFLQIVTTNTGSGLLRLKGIFALADNLERPVVAHAVQHKLYPIQRLDAWPDDDRTSRVVLIGHDMPIGPIGDLFHVLAPRNLRKKGGR